MALARDAYRSVRAQALQNTACGAVILGCIASGWWSDPGRALSLDDSAMGSRSIRRMVAAHPELPAALLGPSI